MTEIKVQAGHLATVAKCLKDYSVDTPYGFICNIRFERNESGRATGMILIDTNKGDTMKFHKDSQLTILD